MGSPLKIVREMTKVVMSGVEAYQPGPAYEALCKAFPLVEISSEQQHKNALRVVEHLIDFLNRDETESIATEANQYLSVLSAIVEKYEREFFPSKRVASNEILSHLMEVHNLNQTDLAEELGGQPVVSMILRGDRALNVRQIRALAQKFKVSPAIFL